MLRADARARAQLARSPRAPAGCSTPSPRSSACGRSRASRARRRWRSSSRSDGARGRRPLPVRAREGAAAAWSLDWEPARARRSLADAAGRACRPAPISRALPQHAGRDDRGGGAARRRAQRRCSTRRLLPEPLPDRARRSRACGRRASGPTGTSASRRTTAASRSGQLRGARRAERMDERRCVSAVPGRDREHRRTSESAPAHGPRSTSAASSSEVNLAFVPEAKVGDYVLVHVGFAISAVDEAEAQRVFEYLRQIGELGDGGPAREVRRRVPRRARPRARSLARSARLTTPALDDHGGLRRADPRHRAVRHRRAAAASR